METQTQPILVSRPYFDTVVRTRRFTVACADLHKMQNSAVEIYASTKTEAILEYVFVQLGDAVYGAVRLEPNVTAIIAKLKTLDYLLTYLEIK